MSGGFEQTVNAVMVLAYMFSMIVVGYLAGRATKPTTEDYYLMSRNVGFILMMFTYLATLQSMVAFLAATASYMTHGVAYLILPLSQGMLMTFLSLLLGWRYREIARENGVISQGELVYYRYGSRVGQIAVGLAGYLFNLAYIGIQVVGMAYILWALGVLDYYTAVFLVGGITLVYVLLGGLRAVVWSDLVQGVLMLLFFLTVGIFILVPLGGITGALSLAYNFNPDIFKLPGPAKFYTDSVYVSTYVILPLGIWLSPHLFIRHYFARDRKSLVGIPLGVLLSQAIMWVFIAPLLGFVAQAVLGPVSKWPIPRADLAIPYLLMRYAPWWLVGPILVGAMAAGMSTVDSQMLAEAQLLIRDVIEPIAKRRLTDMETIRYGRVIIAVTSVVAFIIALFPPPLIIDLMVGIAFAGFAQFFPALVLGILTRRVNKYGMLVGLVVGLGTVVAIQTYQLVYGIRPVGYYMGVHNGAWGLLPNLVLTFIVSHVTESRHQHPAR